MQLEQADRVQGFSLSCDVNSGNASLCQILVENWIRDEAPKAPVLLYASEGQNPFKDAKIEETGNQFKRDLFELNQSFWLGSLARTCDMVIPFHDKSMSKLK